MQKHKGDKIQNTHKRKHINIWQVKILILLKCKGSKYGVYNTTPKLQ